MTKSDSVPEISIRYEDHVRELRERKAVRWAKILAAEPPGRVPGRRKRSIEKEALLLLLDRARIARAKVESKESENPAIPENTGDSTE